MVGHGRDCAQRFLFQRNRIHGYMLAVASLIYDREEMRLNVVQRKSDACRPFPRETGGLVAVRHNFVAPARVKAAVATGSFFVATKPRLPASTLSTKQTHCTETLLYQDNQHFNSTLSLRSQAQSGVRIHVIFFQKITYAHGPPAFGRPLIAFHSTLSLSTVIVFPFGR